LESSLVSTVWTSIFRTLSNHTHAVTLQMQKRRYAIAVQAMPWPWTCRPVGLYDTTRCSVKPLNIITQPMPNDSPKIWVKLKPQWDHPQRGGGRQIHSGVVGTICNFRQITRNNAETVKARHFLVLSVLQRLWSLWHSGAIHIRLLLLVLLLLLL